MLADKIFKVLNGLKTMWQKSLSRYVEFLTDY